MTEHTPTPWTFAGCVRQVDRDRLWCGDIVPPKSSRYRGEICHLQSADQIDGISCAEAEANAAFIVKAVNNHDALIDALETACEYLESEDDFRPAARLREKFMSLLASVEKPQ